MKVAQLSKADASGGGASRVAQDTTRLLRKRGVSATHWIGKGRADPAAYQRQLFGLEGAARRLAREGLRVLGLPDAIPLDLARLLSRPEILRSDILHFHDISSVFSPLSLLLLTRIKPVVWTFHDCSPFTGGCLYPMECVRFRNTCGHCPQLARWPLQSKVDFTRQLRKLRALTHALGRIHCIAPSSWMADIALSSGMLQARPEVVPNGVDTDIFRPMVRAEVRRSLGLPVDERIVLLTSAALDDPRKGTALALGTLQKLDGPRPLLLVVGNRDDKLAATASRLEIRATGFIVEAEQLAMHYAAADLLLFPSLADNMPLVILETMACGTPVVGFATGGAAEMVLQDETGFLVTTGDIDALSRALELALAGDTCWRWGAAARERAVACYSDTIYIDTLLSLYEGLRRDNP